MIVTFCNMSEEAEAAKAAAAAAAGGGGKKEEEEAVTILGTKYPALADGTYDAIILGTGLKECMIAGMLSVFEGKKVLQLDKNGYYGSETASLNLSALYKQFVNPDAEDPPEEYFKKMGGQNRDYNVDLIPKFIMASGRLVKTLINAGVSDYLDFKVVDGCFVYKKGKGIYKMPATATEAATTSLMGFFQKRKFKNFLNWVFSYDPASPGDFDAKTKTMADVYSKFGLDGNTQDFVGHAMALYTEDSYITQPALPTLERIKLYGFSMNRYGKSPFIYPVWGIGGMPEGFSRKCAINGGTFILNKNIDEILFDNSGRAVGVRCGKEAAAAPIIIGEPCYFPKEKVKATGTVVRSVCILDHRVPGLPSDALSAQIIVPGAQAGRSNDMYISVLSGAHRVVPKGHLLAICSTTAEGSKPLAELEPAVALLGGCVERYDRVVRSYVPVGDGSADGCFISESYDATSHFETTINDVASMFQRITGKPLESVFESKDEKK